MEKEEAHPFEELPEALVEEMLKQSNAIGDSLFQNFQELQNKRKELRAFLGHDIKKDRELGHSEIPTTCGVDGSYTIERLLSTDIIAIAAVAVEGLIPPSEKRYWPKPRHLSTILPVVHHDETGSIASGIMFEYELQLISKAPHDVIFLDGSLTTPLIRLNQAIEKVEVLTDNRLNSELLDSLQAILSSYKEILTAPRSDKVFVGVPKYTSRKEVSEKLRLKEAYEDRALLTFILEVGELVGPFKIEPPSSPWHLKLPREFQSLKALESEIRTALNDLHVLYYRPQPWLPAIRLEVSSSIANNNQRLAMLLKGVEYQCASPGIMEPYPLYISDRIVKHLSPAVSAIRQAVTQRMSFKYGGDISDIYLGMHSYRTEGGR